METRWTLSGFRSALLCSVMCPLFVAAGAVAQRSANERRIDDPVRELLARRLAEPDVAYAGGQFLVVWTEQRITGDIQPLTQVLGARVTPEGEVRDPRGIAIASSGALRREPRVVASGDGFIVMWRESSELLAEDSRFARVDAEGRVLDLAGVELPHYVGELGCAGSSCLGAAARALDARALGFDVCGRQNAESMLAIPPRTTSQSGATTSAPRIVSTPCSGHALALAQYDERSGEAAIALAGFTLDGELRFAHEVQSVRTGGPRFPAFDVAANADGDVLLIWQQPAAGSNSSGESAKNELRSLWSDGDGKPLGPPGYLTEGTSPALAFDGEGFVLITGDQVLAAHRLDAHGELVAAEPTPIRAEPPGLRDHVRVAAGPPGALVVWRAASTTIAGEHTAALIGEDGRLLDPSGIAIAASANRQRTASLAHAGEGYALLLRDDRPDEDGLRLFRLDAQGAPVGPSVSVLAGQVDERAIVQLREAGDRLALVFTDDRGPLLSWVDLTTLTAAAPVRPPDADPSGSAVQLVPGEESILALASGRGQLCGEDQPCDMTLSLQLLALDGSAREAPPVRYGPDGEWTRTDAVAASDGAGFVVAFTQARIDNQAHEQRVVVVHVANDGTVAQEPTIVVSSADAYERCVAIAPGGDAYLLVLQRSSGGGIATRDELHGLRLSRDLVPLDGAPFALATDAGRRTQVGATYDGHAWSVVWQERAPERAWDVHGARVPQAPAPPTSFGIAVSVRDELAPTVASASPGLALVAYERFDDDASAMVGRVFLRDLVTDATCSAPDCCDDECNPPPASRCETAPADMCSETDASARRARYGCGCRLGPRADPRVTALATLLALVWLLRRAQVRGRR
jgi:hypothetical protein